MSILSFILSALYPLCGTAGATGITPPGVVDFPHLHLQGHSEFFAGPPGYFQKPDQEIPFFTQPPATLFAALQATAAAQPRTYQLDSEPQALQAAYVFRTANANFPDVIEIAVIAEPDNQSGLVFYSYSLYGSYDYGQNRAHAAAWLKTLNQQISNTKVTP